MLSKFTPFTTILLAFTALADPPRLGEHLARRRASHRSRLTSENWAGVELQGDAGTFTSAAGTFVVPVVYGYAGAGVSFWVGIDDGGCSDILGAGVIVSVGSDGQTVSYNPWYETPSSGEYSLFSSSITINPGDEITATVVVFSDMMSGYAIVQDLTTNESVWEEFNSTSSALCGQTAEWIVEDYPGSSGDAVTLANFGTVAFANANAYGTGGAYPASGGTIIVMEQDDQDLSYTTAVGDAVIIQYTGP